MKAIHMIAFILLVIGGLNWLLVALGWNLVTMIFGLGTTLTNVIYILIGLSALIIAFSHKKDCKMCSGSM